MFLQTTHRYALLDPKLACRFIAVDDDDTTTFERRTVGLPVGPSVGRLSTIDRIQPRATGARAVV